VKAVAGLLGNTAAVCRASYIHPWVFEAYEGGRLSADLAGEAADAERALLDLLDGPEETAAPPDGLTAGHTGGAGRDVLGSRSERSFEPARTHARTQTALRRLHRSLSPAGREPDAGIQRDLELVEWLEQLGYDEAWIGEHHSAAYELIASPEVFIAAAASAPSTSGSAPASPPCPTTTRSCWPTASTSSTT